MTQSKSETPVKGLKLPVDYIEKAKKLCKSGQRAILAIAGAPGSGKSTIASLLHQALPECSVLVPMDGFHLSNKELERLERKSRKGAPDTFDIWGYKNLIERLKHQRQDEIIYAPEFYRTIEEPIAGSLPIFASTSLVITEGNYLCLTQGEWKHLHGLFDQSWFVTADQKERQQRLVDRHCYFGRSLEDAKAWVQKTDEPNAQLIEHYRSDVDLIIHWHNVA